METYKNVEWSDSLSVGYPTIDGHHKKLVSITQEIYSLLGQPDSLYRIKIGKVLKKLSDYTIYHFMEEEKIMRKYQYPSLEEHAKIHASFVEKLNQSLPLMAKGERKIAIEMYNFLCSWLVKHIAKEDAAWAEYIHANYPNETF